MSLLLKHEEIVERLKPFARKGWMDRFQKVKNAGTDVWLTVIRDFDIDDQEAEEVVQDIVLSLEPPTGNVSLVRQEMEKLEMEGKLNMDDPATEEYWQKRIDEENEMFRKQEEEYSKNWENQKKLNN